MWSHLIMSQTSSRFPEFSWFLSMLCTRNASWYKSFCLLDYVMHANKLCC